MGSMEAHVSAPVTGAEGEGAPRLPPYEYEAKFACGSIIHGDVRAPWARGQMARKHCWCGQPRLWLQGGREVAAEIRRTSRDG